MNLRPRMRPLSRRRRRWPPRPETPASIRRGRLPQGDKHPGRPPCRRNSAATVSCARWARGRWESSTWRKTRSLAGVWPSRFRRLRTPGTARGWNASIARRGWPRRFGTPTSAPSMTWGTAASAAAARSAGRCWKPDATRHSIGVAASATAASFGSIFAPPREGDNTTHFSVVDRFGNAVANTTTLNLSYGVGLVADPDGGNWSRVGLSNGDRSGWSLA